MKNQDVKHTLHLAVPEVVYRSAYTRKYHFVEGALYWSLNRMVLWSVQEAVGDDSRHPGLNRYLAKVGR